MGFNSWLLFCYIIPKLFDISVWFLTYILSQLSKMMSFQYLRWKSSLKPVSFGFDPFHFTWTFLWNRYKIYQYILTESPLTLCSHLWLRKIDWIAFQGDSFWRNPYWKTLYDSYDWISLHHPVIIYKKLSYVNINTSHSMRASKKMKRSDLTSQDFIQIINMQCSQGKYKHFSSPFWFKSVSKFQNFNQCNQSLQT